MAKAEKTTQAVLRTVEEERITLTLTPKEASVTMLLVGSLGGAGEVRDVADRVHSALCGAGVRTDGVRDSVAGNLTVREPGPLKVGDAIRILKDGANGADVQAGDVFAVTEIHIGCFRTDGPGWLFMMGAEGTDWERV